MSYLEQEAKALRDRGTPPSEMCRILGVSEARLEQALLGDSVVRVVTEPEDERMSLFLVALSRCGLIFIHRDDASGFCYDILPPGSELSDRWAKRMALALTERGWNAVVAPRWRDA